MVIPFIQLIERTSANEKHSAATVANRTAPLRRRASPRQRFRTFYVQKFAAEIERCRLNRMKNGRDDVRPYQGKRLKTEHGR
jgi:hypothetical protein